MEIRSGIAPWTLLASTAAVALLAGPALAQSSTASTAGTGTLEEVVVTANRQQDTVNKVPLSVAAVTQQTIERRGDKTAQDLFRTVPGLSLRVSSFGGDLVPLVAIRGIAASAGAQTTAVYLDDAPLQKRTLASIPDLGSGSPLPGLFDIDRVEVLMGPQGTLYGGSSEGGTIRFITPTPSLTKFSGMAKIEGSTVEMGSPGYDIGVAAGGPIIEDKVGIRVSLRNRLVGGYIDDVSRLTGQVIGKDVNYQASSTGRIAVLVKPSENLQMTTSAYYNTDKLGDGDYYWMNVPQITVPTKSWQADGKTPATSAANTAYTLPGYTYGPYNFYGFGRSGQVTNVGDNYLGQIPMKPARSPLHQTLALVSNNIQYSMPWFTTNLITSYSQDQNKGLGDSSYIDTRQIYGSPFEYNLPVYTNNLVYDNRRNTDTEELRFTSANAPDQRLTWVGGIFHSDARQKVELHTVWNWGDMVQAARGVSGVTWFGLPPVNAGQLLSGVSLLHVVDRELAAYANANFMLTSKLKLTAGVRVSQVDVIFHQARYGQTTGSLTPILVDGHNRETPVTPKFGVSYQFDPTTMIYANAAQGYRAGGVNAPAPQIRCAADFAAIGIPTNPVTYNSDSVWSYEAGVKSRVFGRAQINADVYYVDWKTPQTNITLPICASSYVINAGEAISKGFETQVTARLFPGFTGTLSVAYDDATQVKEVGLPTTAAKPVFVAKGDKLPVPPWSVSLGGQYTFDLINHPAYVRMDYQYNSRYQRSAGPGTTTFNPDLYMAGATNYASARAGMTIKNVEAAIFVNNLFDSRDILTETGGRSVCGKDPSCSKPGDINPIFTATTFRPREVGASLTYKF